jgi:hypothetical protein
MILQKIEFIILFFFELKSTQNYKKLSIYRIPQKPFSIKNFAASIS